MNKLPALFGSHYIYIFATLYLSSNNSYALRVSIFITSPWDGCWFVVYIRRFIYKFLNVCPFDYTAVAGSGKVGAVNMLTTPVGWPCYSNLPSKSVRNPCVIELFGGVVCVVTLPY